MITKGMMTSKTSEWATPLAFFALLDGEFHFTLDVCATPENAKCGRFFMKADDGLSRDWTGTVWMNPPYGREIGEWMAKARKSAEGGRPSSASSPRGPTRGGGTNTP